jgi:hypothetical protein
MLLADSSHFSPVTSVLHSWHAWVYAAMLFIVAIAWVLEHLGHLFIHRTRWKWLAKHKKAISSLLWSMVVAVFLVGVYRTEGVLVALNAELTNARNSHSVELQSLRAELKQHNQSINDEVRSVRAALVQSDLDRLTTLPDRLDEAFRTVFGRHVSASIDNLKRAIDRREVTLDPNEFRSLWIETLNALPDRTLFAASQSTGKFFWADEGVRRAMTRFLASGGRMKRIFYVRSKPVVGEEAYDIMSFQHEIGVEVFWVIADKIPIDKRVSFLAEEKGYFSWDVEVDFDSGTIAKARGTSDPSVSLKLIDTWRYLHNHAVKFEPAPKTPK